MKMNISVNGLGYGVLVLALLSGFGLGFLSRSSCVPTRSEVSRTSIPAATLNTNNEWIAKINISDHAAQNYGTLRLITNTLHQAVLVTVLGRKERGTCQALLCLYQENQTNFVTVIGLNPFKFIDFLMDGTYPVSDEIYKALAEPKQLFGDDNDHKIRNAIFPLIFRRLGQQWTEEWKKGFYFYHPIQQLTWIRFKCVSTDKDFSKKGFIPTEVSYFIGDDGIVIAHKVTDGIYTD